MKTLKITKTMALLSLLFMSVTTTAKEKEIRITTTKVIQSDISSVYHLIKSYERFPEWSPFVVTDPNQKNHVNGKDGEIGSEFHWEGVDEKSVGYQTLTELKENKYIRMDCSISVPYDSSPTFEYRLSPTANGIKVVQEFSMKTSGFSYFMMRLFGVKKKMSNINELGLTRLKSLLESEQK